MQKRFSLYPAEGGFLYNAFIKLHISVLLAGLSGILGKLISLAEGPLVTYRMGMTTAIVLLVLWFTKKPVRVPFEEVKKLSVLGLLMAFHWLCFYGSIKYSNVSVGVLCFSLTGFFTAILEPVLSKHRVIVRELLFSILSVLGVALIFHLDMRYRTGIILGVLGALLFSLFTIFNKRVTYSHHPFTILFYMMASGTLLLLCLAPLYLAQFPSTRLLPTLNDLVYLGILSIMCTVLLLSLQLQVLKVISAFTVNLSYNLEPAYSIGIAMLFLQEGKEVSGAFWVGLLLICLSVLLQTLFVMRQHKALR